MKLKDIGEHEFIQTYISRYVNSQILNLDAYSDSKKIYKIDGFSLSYIFPFIDYYDIGWKAVTAVASDILVSGGKPSILMSSLGVDPEKDIKEIDLLFKGIYDASRYYGFNYVGGDTNSSDKTQWIDVVGVGDVICSLDNVGRDGDLIIITDEIGYTSKVFISYLNNFKIDIDRKSLLKIKHPIAKKVLMQSFMDFCKEIVTATDISDGLLISLYSLAKRLNKNIKLYNIPINIKIYNELKNYGYSINDILKYSGEEFEALLVVNKGSAENIITFLLSHGLNAKIIGKIEGVGDKIFYNNDQIKITGWDNFKGWF